MEGADTNNAFAKNAFQYDRLAAANNKLAEAKQLMTQQRYDSAVDSAQEALNLAMAAQGREEEFGLVKFYYAFADMILAKFLLVESELGNEVLKISRKQRDLTNKELPPPPAPISAPEKAVKKSQSPVKLDVIKAAASNSMAQPARHWEDDEEDESMTENAPEIMATVPTISPIMPEEKKEEEPVSVLIDEMQIAWENLEAARLIAEKELAKLPNESIERVKTVEALAKIFMRLGDLLVMQGNHQGGIAEYKSSLELRKGNPQGELRDLAEAYCGLGITYVVMGKKDSALENLNAAKGLVEQHLQKLLGFQETEVNKNALLNAFIDSSNQTAKRLQDALREIYQKIEEVGGVPEPVSPLAMAAPIKLKSPAASIPLPKTASPPDDNVPYEDNNDGSDNDPLEEEEEEEELKIPKPVPVLIPKVTALKTEASLPKAKIAPVLSSNASKKKRLFHNVPNLTQGSSSSNIQSKKLKKGPF